MGNFVLASASKFFWFTILLVSTSLHVYADAEELAPELKKRKAAEELALHSQIIVTDYFFLNQGVSNIMAKEKISKNRERIRENIAYLESVVENQNHQALLRYLALTQEGLDETLAAQYSASNAQMMLDVSDVIREGAESIIKYFLSENGTDQTILDVLEYQRYLVERMTKLYVASLAGFQDDNTVTHMGEAISAYEKGLAEIDSFRYPYYMKNDIAKLRARWLTTKRLYENVEKGELPRTVFYATAVMDRILKKLIKYQYKLADTSVENHEIAGY